MKFFFLSYRAQKGEFMKKVSATEVWTLSLKHMMEAIIGLDAGWEQALINYKKMGLSFESISGSKLKN